MDPKSATTIAHRIIRELVPPSASVLDLGCGTGDLLATLRDKGVQGQGVEIDENMVVACLKKGLSVFQGNIDEGLKEYPDKSYDYVILNQTLQAVYHTELVLKEMVRVGRFAVVGIPNFAYWRIRTVLALTGKLPVTRVFNAEWYNTPNIRLVTVQDFTAVCRRLDIGIVNTYFTKRDRLLGYPAGVWPNLFCENALFVLKGR
jgi:methionine biosynthesis protein MetW